MRNYFNSIKVRLRQYAKNLEYVSQTLFQFHKGSIKTIDFRRAKSELAKFQFHKGSIKTVKNSQFLPLVFAFQFHKGSIKTLDCRLTINA